MLCCRLWPEARVFKAELLVGGEVIHLLRSPLEINGRKFYYLVITFLVAVLRLARWVVMFVDDAAT